MDKRFDAVIAAPFGAVAISAQDDFLVGIELLGLPQIEQLSSDPFVLDVIKQLQQYFVSPSFVFDIPYAVNGTLFQKRVWRAIASIPSGDTWSYGELADQVASGPRAVANVCGANQVPLIIPCHRIVAKAGLGGFMQGKENGLRVKQWLLDHESIKY